MANIQLQNAFWVGVGGMIGSVVRYFISLWVHLLFGVKFPWGTLAVNLVGCMAIGMLMYVIEDRHELPIAVRLFLVTGILGGFTTFSAFGLETLDLIRAARYPAAIFYVFASVCLGLGAVIVGRTIAAVAGW